jgi:hypothetical protein
MDQESTMPLRSSPRWAAALLVIAVTALFAVPAAAAEAAAPTANQRLAKAVNRYSRALGVKRDATRAIERADLRPAVAGRFAKVVNQLRRCDLLARANLPAVVALYPLGLPEGVPPVFPFTPQRGGDTTLGFPTQGAPSPPVSFPFELAMRRCGEASVRKLDALRRELKRRPVRASSRINLWPVLRFQPGDRANTYRHDYVLLVDTSGGNTYLNNAGGSGLDIWRGPKRSGAKIVAPARGCIDAFDIIRKRTCTLSSAALLDLGGGNRFGRLETPDPATDGKCTNDPVGRRVFVQGSGILGAGVAIVEGGDNAFVGKVLTTGAGMIGGYGYLRVDGDDNTYKVVRSGLGSSIVGGIGKLVANGDNNTYGYYVPGPSRPGAPRGTLGSGGVVNDLNGCDNGSSLTLGAGAVGGDGVFQAHGVGNSYTAPVNSLGSGTVFGRGSFSQTGGGNDSYAGPGAKGRGNNVTLSPTSNNNGTFTDR